ncbi:hypothetical protein ACHELU_004371 [Vibrio vulnificus]
MFTVAWFSFGGSVAHTLMRRYELEEKLMLNPFENFQLKQLPDLVLVVFGISFLAILGALIGSIVLPGGTLGWFFVSGAFLSFSIAWKNAHYRTHDKTIHKWVNAWHNNTLSNVFLALTAVLLVSALAYFKLRS